MSDPNSARRALAALVAMRIVYAINWLNIGAVFYAMAPDLGSGVVGLGTLTSSFYLGLGLSQVPGGIMAAKWGPKRVVVLGMMVASASALGTGLAPSLEMIAILRFVVGVGMALVFAPAIMMIARLVKGGGSGAGVGIFNSAFDVGGILALFLWGVIASVTGWRPSLELAGGLGLLTGALVMVATPADDRRPEFRVSWEQLWKVIADRRLVIVAMGLLAFSVCNALISSFMEYYLVDIFGMGSAEAGIIASMVVLVPIFSSYYAGKAYDRTGRTKKLMLLSVVGGAGALAACALPTAAAALFCSLLGGLISGFGFTVGFAAAKDMHTAQKEYDGLALAWVNCISLGGAVFPPAVFSLVAATGGYPQAWVVGAALTALLGSPLLFLAEKRA